MKTIFQQHYIKYVNLSVVIHLSTLFYSGEHDDNKLRDLRVVSEISSHNPISQAYDNSPGARPFFVAGSADFVQSGSQHIDNIGDVEWCIVVVTEGYILWYLQYFAYKFKSLW